MRELTFRGFLTQYVRQLSKADTNSIFKLTREAATENPRLREPLILYALYTDKQDVLLRAAQHTGLYDSFSEMCRHDIVSMTQFLESRSPLLSTEYHKVWKSYQSTKNKGAADDHTKELMRRKVLRLQAQKGITNYRIYTDLKLNPGNLNAWLKHGNTTKVSLETARQTLRYIEANSFKDKTIRQA